MKIFDYLRLLLVAIGLLQVIGFATGHKWLKGIGQITVASPLPIVFTEQKGCETFALDFSIEYEDENGSRGLIPVTLKFMQILTNPTTIVMYLVLPYPMVPFYQKRFGGQ